MPRLFGTALYVACRRGRNEKELAELFGVSEEWIHERVEAARLCLEKQVEVILL